MSSKIRVLIAGIAGASLGTEILKCLWLVRHRYTIFGCDISPLAFGHYQEEFERTFLINRQNYIESVLEVCRSADIDCIVPGGEEPLILLSKAADQLARDGLHLAANSPAVIERFTDKKKSFKFLAELGFKVPLTLTVEKPDDLEEMSYPCIVKPATGAGGSSFVFLAENKQEALLYVKYLARNGKTATVQEYISEEEGEYSFGVLSLPDRRLLGSIAMKRIFESKLSVHLRGPIGLIASPYGQGLIDDFKDLRTAAEQIAVAIASDAPLNIQGRVRDGVLIPFEINPRFSGSTYLRAMAGFNEIDLYLRHAILGEDIACPPIQYGYYLRSLSETYVSPERVKR